MYDVIHFNNGLHSLMTLTGAYAKSLKTVFELMRIFSRSEAHQNPRRIEDGFVK